MRQVWLSEAVVTAQDGGNYRLYVVLVGMGCQGPALPVEVGLQGHNDFVRGDWPPLPAVGTHGLVLFPRAHYRNGVWVSSIRSNLTDSNSHVAATPNLRYRAEFSGAWSAHLETGDDIHWWPDGSQLSVGPNGFTPTRHSLTSGFARQTVEFGAAQRVSGVVTPFPVVYTQPTGLGISVSPSGSVTVSGVPIGQSIQLLGDGCSVIMQHGTITLSGVVNVSNGLNVSGAAGVNAMADVVWNIGGGAPIHGDTHTHPAGSPNTGPPNAPS